MERIDAKEYWGEEFSNLKKWQKAEILSANWFITKGIEAKLMNKCHEGYDILLDGENGKVRIDVKWSNGKQRNKDEMQFHLRIKEKEAKGKGKTTDYFLLCFHQKRGDVRAIAGYLVPYNFFGKINDLTITRQNVRKDFEQYELSERTLRELGIMKKLKVRKVKKPDLKYNIILEAKKRTGYFKTEEVTI
ncbi:hypothetical protein K5E_11360 [Enterococcus thailandicus]|uniref:hypothetical protein n=1 Tax=Enterococcus thailandicus TaxID=417368 RepID=UPI00244D9204|nr:hypothetical protein [Enterococcus thailandicus]GMC02566.1 hypothetical protein K4E_00760 [Enterococcus thailandicus]GMC08997.1 hypothetical protein K5E_11360 [Enterococcus thailandicus]